MPLDKKLISKVVRQALAEDAADHDITTLDFISPTVRIAARIIAKQEGVVCGAGIAAEVFKQFDRRTVVRVKKTEGARVRRGSDVMEITGRARSILSCERVALNFLSYLSGISTESARAVRCVRAKKIQILDTRKTTPLWRAFEKYAVLTGGGRNHRLDLSDQYLVKDNHVFIIKRSGGMDVLNVRRPRVPLEIEVDSIRDLTRALAYCPNIVMLDNFSPSEVRRAIRLLSRLFPRKALRPLIELSGGIDLDNLSRYAIRGVDFISLGALTHSSKALDFSLEVGSVDNR